MWPAAAGGVAWSVCLLVTTDNSEPCKTAERTEMPFGVWTCDGTGNHALDMNRESPRETFLTGANLGVLRLAAVDIFNILNVIRKRATAIWSLASITAAICYKSLQCLNSIETLVEYTGL